MLHHMLRAAAQRAFSVLDPYFQYVTMLLHGDGTNGAQNNTFLDSSTNNFSITRNGNTTQGTFTPYGSNWSNYFDGSGDYLQVSHNTALDLGAGDFTVEFWLNAPSWSSGTAGLVGKKLSDSTNGWQIYRDSGQPTKLNGRLGQQNNFFTTSSVTTNVWEHWALVRTGTTLYWFKNGVLDATGSSSLNIADATASLNIAFGDTWGAYANCYLSNLRIVKGTAVYTANFTPSTTPLTAITNTQLLTCQSNRFIDNSTNNFTITKNGDTSVQRFSPFSPTTSYSTSVIGGSGYFDGSGDYLTAAQNAAFNFGTGAFTVEAWVYITASNGTNQRIIGLGDGAIGGGPYTGWSFNINNNLTTINWYRYDGTETDLNASYTFKTNTWYHIVAVRNGSSNLSMYVNGTRVYNNASASLSYNNVNTNPLYVGLTYDGAGGGGNKFFNGYMNDARIVAGSAVYDPTSSTLTVPTAPLTAISGTSLLMNYTNAGILDNAMMNDLETVGNAQISTSVKKYGTGSMYFDGSGDWLNVPNNDTLNMRTGDFTIECWVNRIATTSSPNTADVFYGKGSNNLALSINISTGKFQADNYGVAGLLVSTTVVSNNTWYHFAVTRSGTTLRMFVNGSLEASTTSSADFSSTTNLYVGADPSNTNQRLYGYIDDLRITKGVARYTTTFTPPTAAFPNN